MAKLGKKISWFSAGASSAVATKIALSVYPDLKIIYTHIADQHSDTLRFVKDCEKWFGVEVEINHSPLKSVNNACLTAGFVKSPFGAPCTRTLKRKVRKLWEDENPGEHIYIWGLDSTEKRRAERIVDANPKHTNIFPLIEHNISKKNAHKILEKSGIRRPLMYLLGYPNNNCIGCLKGGMGYWNKIRVDFPEYFESRCKLEEQIGGYIFKEFPLRQLPKNRGRVQKIIVPECGVMCEKL
jgi:hypothetical protein